MDKHAYLIMAHNNIDILEKIVGLLDDRNNDIFLHVDKKCKEFNFDAFKSIIKKGRLFMIRRMDVRWSDFSQIKCELELFKAASKEYHRYYHLISGEDIPLKKQKEIHKFFSKTNKEFICFRNHKSFDSRLDRVDYYHLFYRNARSKSKIKLILSRKLHSIFLKIQIKFNMHRIKEANIDKYRDGANWCSITHDLVRYIVSLEKEIKKKYKYTYCADEVFLQSIVYNSKFYKNLFSYKNDDYNGIKRLIDWNRGQPYNFTVDDYEEVINSDRFFVRKVSDRKLVDKIYNYLMGKRG